MWIIDYLDYKFLLQTKSNKKILKKLKKLKNLMKIFSSWIFGSRSQKDKDCSNSTHAIRKYFRQ